MAPRSVRQAGAIGQLAYLNGVVEIIRFFGNMPEGVSYSILVMNATVFLIEKVTRPRKYGFVAPPKAVKTPEGGKSK